MWRIFFHILSVCSLLAQKEYERRHNKLCLNIHWSLSKKYGVKVYERWYEHKVESVIENHIVKILLDVCIQVDKFMVIKLWLWKRVRMFDD